MNRRELLRSAVSTSVVSALPSLAFAEASGTGREVWVGHLDRMARPVLEALAAGRLRATMPIEAHAAMAATRPLTTHLEAFGRLLSGMAPWLELQAAPEGELHARYLALVHRAMASALDPTSPDRMAFDADRQNLVDAAFLGLAVLRAPRVLNADLDPKVKRWLVAALTRTRALEPSYNNWLLFSACVEAALSALGAPWDAMRVDFALRKHMDWYVGDGTYGDGLEFHWDYYNSFVIHPMLQAILEQVAESRSRVEGHSAEGAGARDALCAGAGTHDRRGRNLPGGGALHLLSLRSLSWSGGRRASASTSAGASPGAGALCARGGHRAHAVSAGDIRCERLAAYRTGRAPAGAGRAVYLDRELVPGGERVSAARAAGGASLLVRARCALDGQAGVGGRRCAG